MSRRRNGGHPEGEPDPWEDDPLAWPPPDPQPIDDEPGKDFVEQLSDHLSFLERLPGLRARVRAFLLNEGLPELYAECVAEDVADGWANGDPAPVHMMPGFVPPQEDPNAVRDSRLLKAATDAWHEKWDEERR